MRYFFIAHGSKHAEHAAAFDGLMENFKAQYPDLTPSYGYLNYAEPKAENVLEKLSAVKSPITIVPIFLGKASHILVDVPELISNFRQTHPDIEIHLCEPLGTASELKEACERELTSHTIPNTHETQALLVGRGSSNEKSLQFIYELKEQLELPYNTIEVAFWDIAKPSFEEQVRDFLQSEQTHLIVQPLFLFPGILLDKLNQSLSQYFSTIDSKSYTVAKTVSMWKNTTDLIHRRMLSASLVD